MSTEPPEHPAQEDIWINPEGDLQVYRGNGWVSYDEVPDGAFSQPEVVVKSQEDGD
jgi:hypothetical protein